MINQDNKITSDLNECVGISIITQESCCLAVVILILLQFYFGQHDQSNMLPEVESLSTSCNMLPNHIKGLTTSCK